MIEKLKQNETAYFLKFNNQIVSSSKSETKRNGSFQVIILK